MTELGRGSGTDGWPCAIRYTGIPLSCVKSSRAMRDMPDASEEVMLYQFITVNRDEIVSRTRDRVRSRPWPSVSNRELEYGVPLFLTQLSETLRLKATATPFASDAIGATAARHGAE